MKNENFINKNDLKPLLEDIIFDKLNHDSYPIKTINARELLTWNRIDLAFKIFYLSYKDKNKDIAEKMYYSDIKAQTLGTFKEGETDKDSFSKFIIAFNKTFNNLKDNGFNSKKTLIPLSKNKTIRNGAHRVASSIFIKQNVSCVITELDDMIADYNYFYQRDVSIDFIEKAVIKFIEYALSNTYIAFLWPSGKKGEKESLSKFTNIVYKKEIRLTSNGGYNLLYELYKHMDWIGNKENGFSGIKQKLVECFPSFEPFTVIVFQASSLEEVRKIKKNVREVHNIGFSSIHITDTKEEAIRISKLLFNKNGLHFLNNASPYKFDSIYNELDLFKAYLNEVNIDTDDVILDGSIVLTLYGIRENKDIDYLILDDKAPQRENCLYEHHDTELKYHQVSKEDLIYDSKYYFEFYGLKFISFQQLYTMKKNRNEEKDKNDCKLMELLQEKRSLKKTILELNQNIFYLKIKYKFKIRNSTINILKKIHLYYIARYIVKIMREMKK